MVASPLVPPLTAVINPVEFTARMFGLLLLQLVTAAVYRYIGCLQKVAVTVAC